MTYSSRKKYTKDVMIDGRDMTALVERAHFANACERIHEYGIVSIPIDQNSI